MWDWPKNVCRLQNIDQICVSTIGILNFGNSALCNLTHTCMLICKLYLNDDEESVCLYMYRIFQFISFMCETELKGHDGIAVYKSLHFSPDFIGFS